MCKTPLVKFFQGLLSVLLLGSVFAHSSTAQEDSGFKYITVTVVDPEGKPLADIDVDIRLDGAEYPLPTNAEGMISFNISKSDKTRLILTVKQAGYASIRAAWNAGETVPEEFTILLQKATTVGGIIHDEAGKPIEGVKIEGLISGSGIMQGGGKLYPYMSGDLAVTDAEGRWRYEAAPAKRVEIALDFFHPDYAYRNIYGYQGGNWEQLHSLKRIVVLKKGTNLEGQVIDPDGLPVVGAKVTLSKGRYYSDEIFAMTDGQGKYRIANVKPGNTTITVLSGDWAPELKTAEPKAGMKPVDFQLQHGHEVRLRVVDQAGQPLAGVKVTPHKWRNIEVLPQSKQKTDADGIWHWELAPGDEIEYAVYLKGYMSIKLPGLSPQEEPHEVVMPPNLVFQGAVTDASSGKPIEKFTITEGVFWRMTDRDVAWQEHRKTPGKQGKYRVAFSSACLGYKIKVEADGYHPRVSRLVAMDAGQAEIDFALEPGLGPEGVVKLSNGKPAVGVEVLMATQQKWVRIENGEHQSYERSQDTLSDDAGRFELPFPESDFEITCVHEAGWATVNAKERDTGFEITLQPWGRVEGVAYRGDERAVDCQMMLDISGIFSTSSSRSRQTMDKQPHATWRYQIQTDDQGKFVFERVKPGSATVNRLSSPGSKDNRQNEDMKFWRVDCEVVAGETVQVQLGGPEPAPKK